jgi:hypothetical protein
MVTLLTYYSECYIIHTQSIFQRRVLRWKYKAWQSQYSCYCTCREKNRQEDELLYCFGTLRFQAIHIDVEKEESSFNSFIFRITITVVSVSLQAELRSYSFAAVFLRRFSLETFPTFHSECVNRNLLLDGLDVHKILTREVKPSRVRIEFQSHVCMQAYWPFFSVESTKVASNNRNFCNAYRRPLLLLGLLTLVAKVS